MIYILKGWVVFEYEGQGEVTFHKGSAALQPPFIRHRELRHSDDLELIEITAPATFETNPCSFGIGLNVNSNGGRVCFNNSIKS